MVKISKLSIFLFLSVFIGCTWFGDKGQRWHVSKEPVIKNKVVDSSRLKLGGNFLISSFKAGVGVEATTELEQISFHISSGIAEELNSTGSPLTIISESPINQAELVLKGYIIKKEEVKGFNKLFGKRIKYLQVKGKILDQKDGKVLLYFNREISSDSELVGFNGLGESLGRQIGRFIHTGSFSKG